MTRERSHDALLAGIAGTRIDWQRTPAAVRDSIEHRLGAQVATAATQPRGFSPALAARLSLTNGARVFVKAIGPDSESGAPGGQESYRREALITAGLPEMVPAAGLVDSWETHGWVVLVFQDVDGHNPAYPWQHEELFRVLHAVGILAGCLTPSPVPAPQATTPGGRRHWAMLATEPAPLTRLSALDPWVGANVERLAEIEISSDGAGAGSTLVHSDIRADNILLTDDAVLFVDWPHAAIGARWLDLLYLLPSVAMQGGPDPHLTFWNHPVAYDAVPEAVLGVLTGFAGFMIHSATQPPPAGLPTLREFQLAQGIEAIRWIRQMMR